MRQRGSHTNEEGGVVAFWGDGALESEVPLESGLVNITVVARGNQSQGQWPKIYVTLDARVVASVIVDSRSFTSYTVQANVQKAGANVLGVALMNYVGVPGKPLAGRNLSVQKVVVSQALVVLPSAMTATAGAKNHPEGDAYVLFENATLSTRVRFRGVERGGLSITARAEPSPDGTWPELRIELDGTPGRSVVIADRRSIPYWMNFASEPGFADLKLSFVNGGAPSGSPTLVIERIELVPL